MKLAIIGGGWVGCHLALTLTARGADIVLFERGSDLLLEASGINQARLHLGFHYPRSFSTVQEQIIAYRRFVETYPTLSHAVSENVYAVASNGSLLDFPTFKAIMAAHGTSFKEVDPTKHGLAGVDGALTCAERAVDAAQARRHFRTELGSRLRLSCPVEKIREAKGRVHLHGETFDYVINATGNLAFPFDVSAFKYELCTMGLYSSRTFGSRAVTIMDGPFASIYPCPDVDRPHLFWLSGVQETVRGTFDTSTAALAALRQARADSRPQVRDELEAKIEQFVPSFPRSFEFNTLQHVVKVKPRSDHDARRWCRVQREGLVLHAFASKISHIFAIAAQVEVELGLVGDQDGEAA